MRTSNPAARMTAAILATLLYVGGASSIPRAARAQGAADPHSKPKELLARAPFDRVTLLDNTTWDIEPLNPRPLPAYDPKKRVKKGAKLPHEGNIASLPGQKSNIEKIRPSDVADDDPFVVIHMLEGDVRDYKVKLESIKSTSYFEDMLIEEAERLIAARNYAKAFEYLLMVMTRQPGWPKLDETVDHLLFEEGGQALQDSDGERGLRLLGELYRRRPDYPGLGDKLASSFLARIKKAYDVGAYATGRRVLRELERLAPANAAVKGGRARYEGRARELFDRAKRTAGAERLDNLRAAAAVWPALDGLESAYREGFVEMPTLDVAVSKLPEPVGPWLRSSASIRTAPLLYRPILAATTEESLKGSNPAQLAASVETFDLARGIRIKIKPGFTWNDGSRPVSAVDVARSLADRASPGLPGYSARWADLLERVETTEDEQVELRLTRPTLGPEHWLMAPVGPAHAGGDGWVSTLGGGRRPVGDGPYRWAGSEGGVAQYIAAGLDRSQGPKIRRIREVRFDSPAAALMAFRGGEVSLIEDVPPDRVGEIGTIKGVTVGHYVTPSLHRVALDGRTASLRNRTLRRALSLAIDRKTLLEETVLRRPPDGTNAVGDGPFLRGTYADSSDVPPLDYNPLLAQMLVVAAKKELGGGTIRLTLEYPPTTVAQAVCPKLAEAWTLVGVEVILKETPAGELEAKLRSGGRYDLAYRASRPGEPAYDAGPTICPGYDAPPSADALASLASPRILQLLLQLDRAPETTAVQSLLLQIDRESRDELPMLPLWQLVDHFARRARAKGIPDEVSTLYQGVETWEVEPWFPAESP